MAIYLFRGLPGSGKTTLARDFSHHCSSRVFVAADDFRVDEEGKYLWLPGRKANEHAHGQCIARVRELVRENFEVVVHNTFVRLREMEPYRKIARELDCALQVITVHDPLVTDEELFERCKHGVPLEQISDMRRRFEY